jgi:hypothetical protein
MMTATMTTISSTTAGEGGRYAGRREPRGSTTGPDGGRGHGNSQSYLDEFARWHNLGVQLREPALAQGRPVTPPVTPTRSRACATTSSRAYAAIATAGFVLALAVGTYGLCRLHCSMAQTLASVLILIFWH